MRFIDEILQLSTLSIIGTEKNTGKTETLNYILSQLRQRHIPVALTSIGTDGETVDVVTQTAKPEITLYPNDLFVTTENYFRQRSCSAEIVALSQRTTALGRLVIARVHAKGNCIISGPNTTPWLRQIMDEMAYHKPPITIIDGALSKKSSASPLIAEGIVLATGAAYSLSIPEITKNIQFLSQLIHLEKVKKELATQLDLLTRGIYAIDENENIIDLEIPSALLLHQYKDKIFSKGYILYLSGMVTEHFFTFLTTQKECAQTEIWVKDFTRIFASPLAVHQYLQKGGKIKLLFSSKLIAITVNPTAPNGYRLNSKELQQSIAEVTHALVFDVRATD